MEQKMFNLTNPQMNMYLLENFYKGTSLNNICGTCIFHSVLDFDLLKKAIFILIQNNDNFKLHFELVNNSIQQFFGQVFLNDIQIIDIPNMTGISKLEVEMQKKVFDIFSASNNFEFKIFRFPNGHGGYVINIHHLLGDSWALGLVARRIADIYNKLINGEDVNVELDSNVQPSSLDSHKYSYADYIHDEDIYLSSEKFKKDNDYWRSIFDKVPDIATIPSRLHSAVSVADCVALRSSFSIPKKTLDTISTFCKKHSVSIFNFLMSVYSIYISKISGTKDFVIGTPILNRCNFAQKQTIGMFISTLPMRFNIDFDTTFIDYTKKVALDSLSMLRHQRYPYEKILELLREKQPDLPNLYNVLLSYQITKTNTDGYNYETRWAFNGNCPDDMQIHILDLNDSGSVDIYYDYKISKFDEKDIEDMHARIMHIISQVLRKENVKISDIKVVSRAEKKLATSIMNNTSYDYDSRTTIVDLFENMVLQHPSRIAVICNGEQLTYEELNKKANQLARYLRDKHIGYDDLIGIMTSRSLEMVIGLIAVIKLGACYIPIDPNYPEERINYLIKNSRCKAILVDNATYNKTALDNIVNVSLDEDFYGINNSDNINANITPDSLMYLIYTSGSTGNPKGVMLTHDNVHNFLLGVGNFIDFKNNKTILSITTICFDIFGLELWGGLTNGLKVVVATEDEQNDVNKLNELCIKNDVEMLQTTPSRMSFFLKNGDDESLKFLKHLNVIMLGGEALPAKIVEEILNKCNAKLFNMYGPTETTIWSTIKEIKSSNDISIGKPIANTTCYILDDDLNLLPPYTPGLLYIGGRGVSRGYFHMPELTLKRFILSPYIKKELIYNTGDLAYYNENGEFYHLGRNDFQVKLRGYRIELGEIENKLLNYAGIKEVAVIADSNYLLCYYTTDDNISGNKKIKENDLVSFLLESLPDYMIPSEFIKLDEMPLTPNGKLDRKSLPKVTKNVVLEEPPSSNTERLLCSIISKVLKKDIKNINEPFISMGLDSLGIIQVQTDLLSSNINITTHQFYKFPTIKKLAEKIDSKNNSYNEQSCQIPDKFKHHSNEIEGKITNVNVSENILGNVLLTGSNGFIGIHILYELLHTTENKIFCLVRGNDAPSRISKLKTAYQFYFNEDISIYFNDRITIIGGDISFENLNMSSNDLSIVQNNVDTIINTAAIVKHYGNINDFEKNNIEGTRNVVNLAYKNNIRLIHLSSISVSGNYLVKQDNHDVKFSENDLYIGQHYEDNNYVYSKMEAEKLIFQYMLKGLTAKILRIGIVSGRFSDGFFQKSIDENAFYGRIKSIVKMHAVSDAMSLQSVEFTPVDLCAKAIVTLAKNSIGDNKVFHIYNHNLITIMDVLSAMKHFNVDVNILGAQDFNNYILNLSKTQKEAIKGIINDLNYDENNLLTVDYNYTVDIHDDFTNNYLHLLSFDWPVLGNEYLMKIIKHMKDVDFI